MATPYVTMLVDEATSTQDLASTELVRSGRPVLIVASRQTTGRGRSGSEWWQAPRAVAASLAIPNDGPLSLEEPFPLAVGLAVRGALAQVAAIDVSLKWPNDLELPVGKVGGILAEGDGEHTVVGCGLNLFWPEPPSGVAAIADIDPGDELGVRISTAWVDRLFASRGRWDRDAYREACSTLGAEITWDPDGRGTAVDVDETGGLVVSTPLGSTTLRSGEVRTVRRMI